MQIKAYVVASNVQHAQAKAGAGQDILNEYWKAHRVAQDERQMVFAVTLEIDVVDVTSVSLAKAGVQS